MLGAAMPPGVPKLYVLPGSHPCAAVEAALRLKQLRFERVDLLPLTQLVAGPLLWRGYTVPGLRMGSERIVGSRAIMRRLDTLAPEPALLPPPGQARERVLAAESWGDEVFQSVPRRVIDAAFVRDSTPMESYAADAKLPLPRPLLRPALPMTAKLLALRNKAREETARADLLALPSQLEQIDGWIAEGVLAGETPNAADLQIGSAIRLLMSIGDVRPLIEGRPAAALAGYFPPQVGAVPAGVLPREWLPAQA